VQYNGLYFRFGKVATLKGIACNQAATGEYTDDAGRLDSPTTSHNPDLQPLSGYISAQLGECRCWCMIRREATTARAAFLSKKAARAAAAFSAT